VLFLQQVVLKLMVWCVAKITRLSRSFLQSEQGQYYTQGKPIKPIQMIFGKRPNKGVLLIMLNKHCSMRLLWTWMCRVPMN